MRHEWKIIYEGASDDSDYATVQTDTDIIMVPRKDASLIAAAPELLVALKDLVATNSDDRLTALIARASRLIAKIEGR